MKPRDGSAGRSSRRSGFGKDLFSPRRRRAFDGTSSDQAAIGFDPVEGGSAPGTAARRDGRPVDLERGSVPMSDPPLDAAGHDPLDVELVGSSGTRDDDSSRVLDAKGIKSVDRVGTAELTSLGLPGGKISGQGTGVEHQTHGQDPCEPHDEPASRHVAQSTTSPLVVADERLVIPRWIKAAAVAFVLFIAAAIAFAVFEPLQVLPRLRLAPGYALTDQDGESFTSETVRGSVTLYAFTALDCGPQCDGIEETMRTVQRRVDGEIDLGDIDMRLVSIVLDPDSRPGDLAAAAGRSGADGASWAWVGGDDETLRIVVGAGFQRYYESDQGTDVDFDPGFVLVDGAGIVRGDYRYQTLADDSDKLVRHIDILSGELRHSSGAAGAAYEAAHLFLCYP